MKLQFLGATGTVTGSKYLLQSGRHQILVDCGLFQGLKNLRLNNWNAPPIDPTRIDAVLLTHAHIDHAGYLPKLVKAGFRGRIYCTQATYALSQIILPDSGYLQEEDAAAANRHGYSKHHPALPLYTEEDARECLKYFTPVAYDHEQALEGTFRFSLHRCGHILGSSFIRVADHTSSVLFSGDIGRLHDPVMKPPEEIIPADYVVTESTYGDRLHTRNDPADELEEIIQRTHKRGGTVVMPAFAVGRAQSLLHYMHVLKSQQRIPDVPVFLDSPMAIDATELMRRFESELRLTPKECAAMCNTAQYVRTVEQSKALNEMIWPKVIISASGMATGGRVLHHLKQYVGSHRNTIVLPGFQAAGTRGDRLARGEKTIRIHGIDWPVEAEIIKLDSMSAHADYQEILSWLSGLEKSAPKKVFITHGEPEAAHSLRDKIGSRFGWEAEVPAYLASYDLG